MTNRLQKLIPDDYSGPLKWSGFHRGYVPDYDKLAEEEHEAFLAEKGMSHEEFEASLEEWEEKRRRRIAEANEY